MCEHEPFFFQAIKTGTWNLPGYAVDKAKNIPISIRGRTQKSSGNYFYKVLFFHAFHNREKKSSS